MWSFPRNGTPGADVASNMRYAYDPAYAAERDRLRGMERLWDPGTFALLDRLGVGRGWRCAEVGAGAGSVAGRLADLVGDAGTVLALDLHPRFVEALGDGRLDVRSFDVRTDFVPPGHDLVHARLLVEHVGPAALDHLVAGVRPGGLLLVEDYDWAALAVDPPHPDVIAMCRAINCLMAESGYDPECGRRLTGYLTARGLTGVAGESRGRVVRGGTGQEAFFRLSLQSLAPTLIDRGIIDVGVRDRALAGLDDPETVLLTPVVVAAWGYRHEAFTP